MLNGAGLQQMILIISCLSFIFPYNSLNGHVNGESVYSNINSTKSTKLTFERLSAAIILHLFDEWSQLLICLQNGWLFSADWASRICLTSKYSVFVDLHWRHQPQRTSCRTSIHPSITSVMYWSGNSSPCSSHYHSHLKCAGLEDI